MDDLGVRLNTNSADPHGEPVVGSDGKTYSVGNKITSQELLLTYDVCTPTHIFVNLVHNTGEENYKTYIPQTVSIIQSELPKAVVCLMVIDETGTFFPADYPDYQASQITMGALHTKNSEIYNYIKENIEDEAIGVYLLAMQFVQPTARSYPTYEYVSADSIEKNEKSAGLKYPAAAGPNYHPNNYAHSAWGYAMYSFLKWVMSK
jgi:hypothetical protein